LSYIRIFFIITFFTLSNKALFKKQRILLRFLSKAIVFLTPKR